MENRPLKRSSHIIPLSQDHHSGLLFCWKIKEGIKKGVELFRIRDYINFYWDHFLKEHFLEEEELLFNQLDDVLSRQGKEEHLMLRDKISGLNNRDDSSEQDYLSLAELLIMHIRFEERVLFPYFEAHLPAATLASVGAYLKQQHETPLKDDYPDEFWVAGTKNNKPESEK